MGDLQKANNIIFADHKMDYFYCSCGEKIKGIRNNKQHLQYHKHNELIKKQNEDKVDYFFTLLAKIKSSFIVVCKSVGLNENDEDVKILGSFHQQLIDKNLDIYEPFEPRITKKKVAPNDAIKCCYCHHPVSKKRFENHMKTEKCFNILYTRIMVTKNLHKFEFVKHKMTELEEFVSSKNESLNKDKILGEIKQLFSIESSFEN